MFWYIFICFCLAIIYILWNVIFRGEKWKRFFLVVMLGILWFFATYRDNSVGADTKNYLVLFEQIRECNFKEAIMLSTYDASHRYIIDWEIGFKFILYVYSKVFFFLPYRSVGGFITFLTLLFLYRASIKQSPYEFLTVWLYVTLAFFQTSLNMMQNALAIMIVLWAIQFINEKKMFSWIIAIILASFIHLSSLVFLPMYWIARIKFNRHRFSIVIFLMIGVSIFSEKFIRVIAKFVPSRYMVYLKTDKTAWLQLLVLLVHCLLIWIVVLVSSLKNRDDKEGKNNVFIEPYFMFFLAEIALYILSMSAEGLLRGATLFSPVVVLYIPVLIKKGNNLWQRKISLILIIVISFLGYLFRMSFNNIGQTQPYSFIFSCVENLLINMRYG